MKLGTRSLISPMSPLDARPVSTEFVPAVETGDEEEVKAFEVLLRCPR